VTNADEAEMNCRYTATASDTATLASFNTSSSGGRVTVHQTAPLGTTSYLPWAQPYTSKLFGLGLELVRSQEFDLIVGWYLEPYGLVAAQIAEIAGVPLLLRHAGSDIGRLANHQDLRPAYRWALQRADYVLTGPRARDLVVELGAEPDKLLFGGAGSTPDYFSIPFSPIDVGEIRAEAIGWFRAMRLPEPVTQMLVENLERGEALLRQPTIGIYGKVADSKGSYDLISALERLAASGTAITLFGAVGGQRELFVPFLEALSKTRHLRQCTVLLPFVAPWRIPGFLDACDLVCFLERDFDVAVHRTRVPLEVITRGRALVMSGEAADKQLFRHHLVDGKNYIRIEDPTEVTGLARTIGRHVSDLAHVRNIAANGRLLAASLFGTGGADGPAVAIEGVISNLPAR
jgi:hypothetical protein